MRDKFIDVGAPYAEQMRFLPIFFGEPESVLSMDDTRFHDGDDPCFQLAFAELVLDVDPLAVCNAELGGVLRVNLKQWIRIEFAKQRNLLALGVEVGVGARACGENERVLVHKLRR